MYWYQPERKLLAANQKDLIWLSPVKPFYHSFTWRHIKHASQIGEWSKQSRVGGRVSTTVGDCIKSQIIQMCRCEAKK